MKKLGFGLMRLPLLNVNDYTSVDIEVVKKMADLFMEQGFSYFDTAMSSSENSVWFLIGLNRIKEITKNK